MKNLNLYRSEDKQQGTSDVPCQQTRRTDGVSKSQRLVGFCSLDIKYCTKYLYSSITLFFSDTLSTCEAHFQLNSYWRKEEK